MALIHAAHSSRSSELSITLSVECAEAVGKVTADLLDDIIRVVLDISTVRLDDNPT